MTAVQVEVSVAEGVEESLAAGVAEVVRHALEAERVEEGVISVALVADAGIQELNEEYLGHAGPTDVISFPLHQPGESVVGDVYIGTAQAELQAEELGVPLQEEILRLAIHGTLHVLGYDHPQGEGREESPMYRRQEDLLSTWLTTRREH